MTLQKQAAVLKGLIVMIFCLALSSISIAAEDFQPINFTFYNQSIHLEVSQNAEIFADPEIDEEGIVQFYKSLNPTKFSNFLEQLIVYREEFQLNDWLFYELIHKGLDEGFAHLNENQVQLITWFLLNQCGYDTRLSYLSNNIWIYAFTEEEMFEVSMIQDDARIFVNLTDTRLKIKNYKNQVYLLDYKPSKGGSAFSFNLSELPRFKSEIQQVNFSITFKDELYSFNFEIDKSLIFLMNQYPFIQEQDYLKVPFSNVCQQTLLPVLKKYLKGRSPKEKLEFLATFTRQAFKYKEDHKFFGKSKPMIAEEVFFHKFSDCEDRCALFYNLNKSTMDLPMLVVALPDHLTIAVALEEEIGSPIRFEGKNYYFCDPTGPFNSSKIGSLPIEYRQSSYQILDNYK